MHKKSYGTLFTVHFRNILLSYESKYYRATQQLKISKLPQTYHLSYTWVIISHYNVLYEANTTFRYFAYNNWISSKHQARLVIMPLEYVSIEIFYTTGNNAVIYGRTACFAARDEGASKEGGILR